MRMSHSLIHVRCGATSHQVPLLNYRSRLRIAFAPPLVQVHTSRISSMSEQLRVLVLLTTHVPYRSRSYESVTFKMGCCLPAQGQPAAGAQLSLISLCDQHRPKRTNRSMLNAKEHLQPYRKTNEISGEIHAAHSISEICEAFSYTTANPNLYEILKWYIFFGFLHEAMHIVAALVLGVSWQDGILFDGLVPLLFRTIIWRQSAFFNLTEENVSRLFLVRHAGWVFSVILSLLIPQRFTHAQWAAAITAVEAITTDLLQWEVYLPGIASQTYLSTGASVLFCGNFGMILLHHSWCTNQSKSALDILETMVRVTMMRGAQSGGVITFLPSGPHDGTCRPTMKGIRSRVVNQKRTDLSVLVRKIVQREVFGFRSYLPEGFVPVLSGHTRFATSSKATLDGTHPHRWTPATKRHVYDFCAPASSGKINSSVAPQVVKVENYITHNGDFDFYTVHGKTYDIEIVQKWLEIVTESPMPASVDSCAVAGLIDILRTQGCFGLSARYALSLGLPTSKIERISNFPSYSHFERIEEVFEEALGELLDISSESLESVAENSYKRQSLAQNVLRKLEHHFDELVKPMGHLIDPEMGAGLLIFCTVTVDAFFDNDLFMATKTFLKNAKGSFGLCVTSSLDVHRQICLAARGQTMSVAFYPEKGFICYGSEQAAVKAGLNVELPGVHDLNVSRRDVDNKAVRLDLDDLGGEIVVLDWGMSKYGTSPVSKPNRYLTQHMLMKGRLHAVLYQESKATTQDPELYHRLTLLSGNAFIKPIPKDAKDLILTDIQSIPQICQSIQDDWHSDKAGTSLNRLTAYNLSRCLRGRLEAHLTGNIHSQSIDILLTGCEVSLWLAEQFASDLQKSFPTLRIKAISSNKLLGLFGQDISVPATGFPYSSETCNFHDSIIIIVSHSGGTFAPLSCSNLLQSATKNIFVVTSEWDTQIAKQLRMLDNGTDQAFNSRIFSTEVGMRPAEPCSISVVATHQLLTNLFEYIAAVILSHHHFCRATGAVISEQDLLVLEKCNQLNVDALTAIVGVDCLSRPLMKEKGTNLELKQAGDVWADHILENARAYVMSFVYIFVTLVAGYPIFHAIAYATGMSMTGGWIFLIRLLDASIYFWLPQINVIILRLIQRRNLLHRMVTRTVVIGDIPWVSQSAEAFLSKIFACSYSIAGVNVLSGNPVDHFVHRHTHRVVRGSLVICGRPDGRLSALSTAEAAVCLSVNQASSIQSLGGTCESITIGHNPFKLPLSCKAIFLERKRPLFLCERILIESDVKEEKKMQNPAAVTHRGRKNWNPFALFSRRKESEDCNLDLSRRFRALDTSVRPQIHKRRSAAALIGAYMNLEEDPCSNHFGNEAAEDSLAVEEVISSAIFERKWSVKMQKLFEMLDSNGNGFISREEFLSSADIIKSGLTNEEARDMFTSADLDNSGEIDYHQFLSLVKTSYLEQWLKLPPSNRDERGIIQIQASQERYFGELSRKYNAGKSKKDVDFTLARSQHFSQMLYESRIASLQRFVAMTVMFHQMGMRVQNFFEKYSFGVLGYRMDRTHSIMRIATTASPISGSDVRQRMRHLQMLKKVTHSLNVISMAYLKYREKKRLKQ